MPHCVCVCADVGRMERRISPWNAIFFISLLAEEKKKQFFYGIHTTTTHTHKYKNKNLSQSSLVRCTENRIYVVKRSISSVVVHNVSDGFPFFFVWHFHWMRIKSILFHGFLSFCFSFYEHFCPFPQPKNHKFSFWSENQSFQNSSRWNYCFLWEETVAVKFSKNEWTEHYQDWSWFSRKFLQLKNPNSTLTEHTQPNHCIRKI